jgi:hypothetical protein
VEKAVNAQVSRRNRRFVNHRSFGFNRYWSSRYFVSGTRHFRGSSFDNGNRWDFGGDCRFRICNAESRRIDRYRGRDYFGGRRWYWLGCDLGDRCGCRGGW